MSTCTTIATLHMEHVEHTEQLRDSVEIAIAHRDDDQILRQCRRVATGWEMRSDRNYRSLASCVSTAETWRDVLACDDYADFRREVARRDEEDGH
jgi:hypothetical protein